MVSAIVARAPVRISFAGGGTDLPAYYVPYGGLVVSAAINRYCLVVAARRPDGRIRISSGDYQIAQSFSPGEIPAVEEPLSLPKAAVEWFAPHGLRERGVDLFLTSEVPPGTGLGSSSAMAVALVHALSAYLGLAVSPERAAETACRLEIERLDMPIGKQDQYASAFGGLNAITFGRDGVAVSPLDLPPDVGSALAARLLLFCTGAARHSGAILRHQQAETGVKPAVTESLHRIKRLAGEMRQALLDGNLDGVGELLDAGWQYKKRLSSQISSQAIDRCYDAACAAGALGGKITGAGGGGFLLLYCPPPHQPSVRAAMSRLGLEELPFDFDFAGAHVLRAVNRAGNRKTAPTNLIPERALRGKRLERQRKRTPIAHGPQQEDRNHA